MADEIEVSMVHLDGNHYEERKCLTIEEACAYAKVLHIKFPNLPVVYCRPDQCDMDFDGLTDEERESLEMTNPRTLLSADYQDIELRALAQMHLTLEQLGEPGSRSAAAKSEDFAKLFGSLKTGAELNKAAAVLGARDDREAELAARGFTQTVATRIQDLYAYGDEPTVYLVDRISDLEAGLRAKDLDIATVRALILSHEGHIEKLTAKLAAADPERKCGDCSQPWGEHRDCDGFTPERTVFCNGDLSLPFVEPGKTRKDDA